MDRFNKDFHDSDPISGRPFSGGYPDGIWVIRIIISLFLVATIIGIAVAAMGALKEGKGILAIGGIAVTGLIPVSVWGLFLYLLVKRSAGIIPFSAILGILAIVSGLFMHMNTGSGIAGSIVAFLLFLYIAFYGEGLRKDGLIGNIDAQNSSAVTAPAAVPPTS